MRLSSRAVVVVAGCERQERSNGRILQVKACQGVRNSGSRCGALEMSCRGLWCTHEHWSGGTLQTSRLMERESSLQRSPGSWSLAGGSTEKKLGGSMSRTRSVGKTGIGTGG